MNSIISLLSSFKIHIWILIIAKFMTVYRLLSVKVAILYKFSRLVFSEMSYETFQFSLISGIIWNSLCDTAYLFLESFVEVIYKIDPSYLFVIICFLIC